MEFDKLAKAKSRIATREPFFAGLVRSRPFVEAPWVATAATDGDTIFYNKAWFETLTVAEVAGVILHEVFHIIWMHCLRGKGKNHMLWNMACDYVINPMIADLNPNHFKLPAGGLLDQQYKNKSAYEVYASLVQNPPKIKVHFPKRDGDKQDGSGGQDSGGGAGEVDLSEMWGGIIEPVDENGVPLTESAKKQLESEIAIEVQQARDAAKAIGKMPAGLDGLFKAMEKPEINWHEYIQQWVVGTNPDDYTWTRPNRTYMANYGIYMPRMRSVGSGHGVLSIDCSGSVSDEELQKYATEIAGVIQLTRPEKLTVIVHDAIVQLKYEWQGEPFTHLKIKGRGGTCVAPVFKEIEKMEEKPDWFIGFSDMEIGDYPKNAPDFPVLWCATGNSKAPFGHTIHLRGRYD